MHVGYHAIPRPTITDARGRSVTPIDPFVERVVGASSYLDQETRQKICREVGPGIDGRLRIAVIIGFVGIGLAVGIILVRFVAASFAAGSIQFNTLGPHFAALLGIEGGVVMLALITRSQRASRIVRSTLQHGRCPHCGQDLSGTPRQPSTGETVCAECGCAWVVPGDTPESAP